MVDLALLAWLMTSDESSCHFSSQPHDSKSKEPSGLYFSQGLLFLFGKKLAP